MSRGSGKTKKDSLLLISVVVAELHSHSDYDPLSVCVSVPLHGLDDSPLD